MPVISIFSPKGGVGKTTLTLALADVLAQNKKVCVVEFDFSPGDFASILNVDKDKNILRAVNFGVSENLQRPPKKQFDVIIGGYPDVHERFTPEQLNQLVDELANMYEIVIFDIQPGLIDKTLTVLERSDRIIAIAEDTETVKVRLARTLAWLKQVGSVDYDKILIVVNKFQKFRHFDRNVVGYTVPKFNRLTTYENKALRKALKGLADIVEGKARKKGLFGKHETTVDGSRIAAYVNETVKKYCSVYLDEPVDFQVQFRPESLQKDDCLSFQMLEGSFTLKTISDGLEKNSFKEGNRLVYVGTEIPKLDDMLKKEIAEYVTDDFEKSKIVIVSATDKDRIDSYANLDKKVILLTVNELEEYAKSKGFAKVFSGECSIPDIITAVEELKGELLSDSTPVNVTETVSQTENFEKVEDNKEVEKIEEKTTGIIGNGELEEEQVVLKDREEEKSYTGTDSDFDGEMHTREEHAEIEFKDDDGLMYDEKLKEEFEELEDIVKKLSSAVSSVQRKEKLAEVETFVTAVPETTIVPVPEKAKEISEKIMAMLSEYAAKIIENTKRKIEEYTKTLENEKAELQQQLEEKDKLVEVLQMEKQKLIERNNYLKQEIKALKEQLVKQEKRIQHYEQFKQRVLNMFKQLGITTEHENGNNFETEGRRM